MQCDWQLHSICTWGLTFKVRGRQRRRHCCRSAQSRPAVVCPLDRRVSPVQNEGTALPNDVRRCLHALWQDRLRQMRASVLRERKPSRSTARSEPVLKRQREFAAQLVLALQRLSERATTSNASSLEGCNRRGGRRSTDSPCRTWRGTASMKNGGANARSVIGNCTRLHVGANVVGNRRPTVGEARC